MWVCMNCGAIETCDFFPPDCICGIEKSWEEKGAQIGRSKLVRAAECDSRAFERHPSGESELDSMLDGGWPLGFSALIWGMPGAGKSRLTYRWGSRMTPCLILVLENGPAPRCYTLARQLLEHAGGTAKGVYFSNDKDGWETYANQIRPRSIICDSIGIFDDPIETLKQFAHWAAKNKAFVWSISHATKAGDAKGLNELQHWPDATMVVKKTPYNTARLSIKKSRFCAPGFCELPIVWDEPEPQPSRLYQYASAEAENPADTTEHSDPDEQNSIEL